MASAGRVQVSIRVNSAAFEAALGRISQEIADLPAIHVEVVEDKPRSTHMQFIGQIVARIHNAWLALPGGVRAALGYSAAVLVAAAIGLLQAFNWIVPTSVVAAKGEAIAFLTYAVPVLAVLVAQLVRSQIAPALVAWFLSTFGFVPVATVTTNGRAWPVTSIWVKAA
jgi:hypothetical protein